MKIIFFFILTMCYCYVFVTNAEENINEVKTIPYKIKNFWMKNCYKNPGALNFKNAKIKTINNNIVASGTMITTIDLVSPIQVSVYLKKKIWGPIWLKVPCVNHLGSCNYEDACSIGISANDSCPANFDRSQFPCRCPISKGIYNLFEGEKIPKQLFMNSWTSGEYNAQVTVKKNSKEIGCYIVSFSLFDNYY